MTIDPRATVWNQFILAAALARTVRPIAERAGSDLEMFSYTDTHAGTGRLAGPLPAFAEVLRQRHGFANQALFSAFPWSEAPADHPGSWVLAGRVLTALGGPRLAVEMDVNDIDPTMMEQGKANREQGWVRLWSHDWFLFLRSRLGRPERPHFVFIDPPADDGRGCAYGIDAAILLDTMKVPYMLSYPAAEAQSAIDQIGRTGLEFRGSGAGLGVLLGGGAETVLLDVITDLHRLAAILGGEFSPRLPQGDDYVI